MASSDSGSRHGWIHDKSCVTESHSISHAWRFGANPKHLCGDEGLKRLIEAPHAAGSGIAVDNSLAGNTMDGADHGREGLGSRIAIAAGDDLAQGLNLATHGAAVVPVSDPTTFVLLHTLDGVLVRSHFGHSL